MSKEWVVSSRSKISLRTCNNFLTLAVAALALYIAAAPFLPQLSWWLRHDTPIQAVAPKKTKLAAAPANDRAVQEDALFIPRIELEEPIYGGGEESLSKGIWRVAHTSTPDRGGNTVLVGHRFTYKNPAGVLYHLDKVQVDDPITVHWQGEVYNYRVAETRVVPADELSVESDTQQPRLTVYTCTPIWSVTHRLVVVATPVEAE